jgi:heat shock protein 1/8
MVIFTMLHTIRETMDACAIAGLKVLQIIDKPTAVAVAYSLENKHSSKRNIIIFELGGGTINASLLTIEGRAIEVKANAGGTDIGSDDFDDCLVDFCVRDFSRKNKKGTSTNVLMLL